MKPFLCIDTTYDKKNEEFNGSEFIVAKPSKAQSEALEKNFDRTVDMIFNKTPIEKIIDVIKAICCLGGLFPTLIVIAAVAKAENVTLKDLYQNAPWAFYLVGTMLVIWCVLEVITKIKEKAKEESDENKELDMQRETISRNIYNELGVPYDADELELLFFRYKEKDGDIAVKTDVLTPTGYDHISMRAFTENNKLCISDLEGKYEFDLSEMKAIKTVNKRIAVPGWLKDAEYNKGDFKKYKISSDKDGNISFKPYHILEFEHNGEIWCIYFPCYELETIEKLTGLKAEDI